jgi:hypothetical protein
MTGLESWVCCEGLHDRAFWKWMLLSLGCRDLSKRAGRGGRVPVYDPFGDELPRGQFGFASASEQFVRVVPCEGKNNVLRVARSRLGDRVSKPVRRLVICADDDTNADGSPTGTVPLSRAAIQALCQQLDPTAAVPSSGAICLDRGGTEVCVTNWSAADPPAAALPNQQTLERLVCAAIVAAHPARGTNVVEWLRLRQDPPPTDPKEFAWSHMAGWYAKNGCDDFYRCVWGDDAIAEQLRTRLQANGTWAIAEALAQ